MVTRARIPMEWNKKILKGPKAFECQLFLRRCEEKKKPLEEWTAPKGKTDDDSENQTDQTGQPAVTQTKRFTTTKRATQTKNADRMAARVQSA